MKRRQQREKAAESALGSKLDNFGVELTKAQRSVNQDGWVMRLLCLCFPRNTHIWREDALFFSFGCSPPVEGIDVSSADELETVISLVRSV